MTESGAAEVYGSITHIQLLSMNIEFNVLALNRSKPLPQIKAIFSFFVCNLKRNLNEDKTLEFLPEHKK